MAKEFFEAHFVPEGHGRLARFANSLTYYLAALVFNAFPLPQREAGTRDTLRYMGDLIEATVKKLKYNALMKGVVVESDRVKVARQDENSSPSD